MGFRIEDGKGRGLFAGVTRDNKLLANAETNLSPHFVSLNDGLAFNSISTCSSCAAGNFALYFKNDDVDRLFS